MYIKNGRQETNGKCSASLFRKRVYRHEFVSRHCLYTEITDSIVFYLLFTTAVFLLNIPSCPDNPQKKKKKKLKIGKKGTIKGNFSQKRRGSQKKAVKGIFKNLYMCSVFDFFRSVDI